jgi:hypothetical protein
VEIKTELKPSPTHMKTYNLTYHPLPPFPVFSNDWDAGVQLAWLDNYIELIKREDKE